MDNSTKISHLLGKIFFIFLVSSLACTLPITLTPPPETSKKMDLQTDLSIQLTTGMVTPEGGILTVSAPGTPIDEFTINVPPGAYSQDISFSISIQNIQSHNLPEGLTVITPLIRVENTGIWADEYVEVTLPVQLTDGEFAMLFTYDAQTGQIEALPLLALDNNHLTAATFHFSDLFSVKIDTAALDALDIQTGFRQGINNWQFTNYGSYIAPGGHCAGQTMMAMDFFSWNPGVNLNGLYDNFNNDPILFDTTPKNWYDDRSAYRLCSLAQYKMDWEGKSYKYWLMVQDKWFDWTTYYSLSLALMASGQPQMVAIYNNQSGHAIIVYAKQGDKFSVSDPNYPAKNANRSLQYTRWKMGFEPYYSGPNANNLGEAYPVIRYLNKNGLLSKPQLQDLWNAFFTGTIGEGEFPSYTLKYFFDVPGLSFTEKIVNDSTLFVDDDTPNFTLEAPMPTYMVVYDKNNKKVADSRDMNAVELNLTNRDGTPYMFGIFGKIDNNWAWIDGRWVNLIRSYTGTWHSRARCDESESDPYKWEITLTQEESGRISGDLYFHNCPGGGAVYYAIDGYYEAGKKNLQLDGFLTGGRGDLFDTAPSETVFTIKHDRAPSPNFAP